MEGSYFADRFLPGEKNELEMHDYIDRWNAENPGRENENPYLREDIRLEIMNVLNKSAA